MQISGISAISYFNKKKISSKSSYSTKLYANDSISFTANKVITTKSLVEKAIIQIQDAFKKVEFPNGIKGWVQNGYGEEKAAYLSFKLENVNYEFHDATPELLRNGMPTPKNKFLLKIKSKGQNDTYKLTDSQYEKASKSLFEEFSKKVFAKIGFGEDKETVINQIALKTLNKELDFEFPQHVDPRTEKNGVKISYGRLGKLEFFSKSNVPGFPYYSQKNNITLQLDYNSPAAKALNNFFKMNQLEKELNDLNQSILNFKNEKIIPREDALKQAEQKISEAKIALESKNETK